MSSTFSICQNKELRKPHWNESQRAIFKLNKKIPTSSEVELFSFKGNRVRLLNIREQVNEGK